MDQDIDAHVIAAIEELEDVLSKQDPEDSLALRYNVLLLLMRNGLIHASKVQRDGDAKKFVEASRVLERHFSLH